jgi:hypothetical protein
VSVAYPTLTAATGHPNLVRFLIREQSCKLLAAASFSDWTLIINFK